jgi:hypothetical protein
MKAKKPAPRIVGRFMVQEYGDDEWSLMAEHDVGDGSYYADLGYFPARAAALACAKRLRAALRAR